MITTRYFHVLFGNSFTLKCKGYAGKSETADLDNNF